MGVAQARGTFGNCVHHRLQIGRRTGDYF
jgi:hypothetical protein